ncbi:MAG: glycosyltransferase family 39 protein [Rhodospirillaceae bacterium]|nr:glycosyltransferase family 39 protein [Rhodospirillaceae bacterium]
MNQTPHVATTKTMWAALLLLCLAIFIPGQTALPVMDRDEARFAQASKQMLESGDFVHIYFQETPRAKKPVGIYWLQSASAHLFGGANAPIGAYRLPSILGAIAAVLATFYFGSFMFGARIAFLAAGFLASSLIVANEAHLAKTDAVLLATTVMVQGTLARYYLFSKNQTSAPGIGTFGILWLAMGAGILIKGPVTPLVALLSISVISIWDKNWNWFSKTRPLFGIVIAALVAMPWAIAVSFDGNGAGGGGNFIVRAISEDLLPKLLGAQESHGAPPGYYSLLSLVGLWPASLFLLPAVWAAIKMREQPAVRFALAWAIPLWLVFELIPTKLPHYVLPAFPALTLLIAHSLANATNIFNALPARIWAVIWVVPGLALGVAAIVLPFIAGDGFNPWSLMAAIGAAVATFWGVLLFFKQRLWQAATAIIVGGAITYGSIFQGVLPALNDAWISERMATNLETYFAENKITNNRPVILSGYNEPSAIFLLGTKTRNAGPEGAAGLLASGEYSAAFISENGNQAFLSVINSQNTAIKQISTINGFNYSKGKKLTLHIYVPADRIIQ